MISRIRRGFANASSPRARLLVTTFALFFAFSQLVFVAHAVQHQQSPVDNNCVVCLQVSHGGAHPLALVPSIDFIALAATEIGLVETLRPQVAAYHGSARSPPA